MVKDFLRIIRVPNLLIVVLIIFGLQYWVFGAYMESVGLQLSPQVDFVEMLLLAISMMAVTGGGYIINDIIDVKADQINKPEKTIIGRSISEKLGYRLYAALNVLGIGIAYYLAKSINMESLVYIPIFVAALLWIYSFYLKHVFFLGNLLISILAGILPMVFFLCEGSSFIAEYNILIKSHYNSNFMLSPLGVLFNWCLVLSVFAFSLTLIREIIKDIEDEAGDAVVNSKTMTVVLGRSSAKKIAGAITLLFLIFSSYSLFFYFSGEIIKGPIFLIYNVLAVLLPTGYLSYLIFKAEEPKDFSKASKLCKIIMLAGILNMLLYYILV